jgi:hypothetical protein
MIHKEGVTTMQPITSSYKTLHVVHNQHMHRKVKQDTMFAFLWVLYTLGLALLKRNASLYDAWRLLFPKLLRCNILLLQDLDNWSGGGGGSSVTCGLVHRMTAPLNFIEANHPSPHDSVLLTQKLQWMLWIG